SRRLTAELFDPYAVSENAFRLGTVDQQQAKLRDPRLTDEQRDKLRQLIDLTKELNSAEKESADNLSRTNALRLERQALRDSLPVAEKRVADEAAEQAQKEQEQQTRQQSQLERKLQAEQRRQQGQVDRRADKQGRLDAILAGENDPAEAILMEMKSRLETANSIASEPMRATMVGMIRKSAVEKLAAEELRGQPQESSERRLGGTYLKGSAEAYRTIQTATAQARETPEAKHLKAIERISKDQLDSLTELVDLFSRDPIQVVGP
ncbi:MAG: hypothetical protein IT565_14270, partial [Rhodospirillales bacterium]|nr:hypothetical protein [Rhodospirillales bacterium]